MYFHNSLIPRGAYFLLPLESKQEATSGWNFTKCISEVKVNQLKVKNIHVRMGISTFNNLMFCVENAVSALKNTRASGGSAPLDPAQGLFPWTPRRKALARCALRFFALCSSASSSMGHPVISCPRAPPSKVTPLPIFRCFCTPKRCTCVHCLVLKNNPNYMNF